MLRVVCVVWLVILSLSSHYLRAQSMHWGNLDIDSDREGWRIELQRISLNFSATQIDNQELYASFSNNKITGNSQLIVQGYGNLMVDYYARRFVFFNSFLGEYGQTVVYPKNNIRVNNKTLDRILLSTGYTQRIWKIEKFGNLELGPFAQLNFQTQFTPTMPLPYRRKILRFQAGFRLFDGVYIQNLSVGVFGEEDFSDIKRLAESMGAETTINIKKKIREGVDLSGYINYRHYIVNNYSNERNPEFELELNMRLDTVILKNLTIAPFVSLYLLKGRYIEQAGTNLFVGVALGYGRVFKDNKRLVVEFDEK